MLQINAFVGLNDRNIKITCNVNIFRVFAKITRFKENNAFYSEIHKYFKLTSIYTSKIISVHVFLTLPQSQTLLITQRTMGIARWVIQRVLSKRLGTSQHVFNIF